MLATSLTAALLGVEAHLVTVEADSAPGFPRFTMVGLADSALKESESRIRAALRNCGIPFQWDRRITVNLAPASLRKCGSSFDLATALGLLAADGDASSLPQLRRRAARGRAGARRQPAPGGRACCRCCCSPGATASRAAIVPAANHREAALAPGLPVLPRRHAGRGASRLLSADELPRPARASARRGRRRAGRRRPGRRARPGPGAPGARDRRRRAGTTCCSSARPARARRCWRGGCPGSCPRSPRRGRRDRGDPLGRRPVRRGGGRAAALPQPPPHGERRRPSWAAASARAPAR